MMKELDEDAESPNEMSIDHMKILYKKLKAMDTTDA